MSPLFRLALTLAVCLPSLTSQQASGAAWTLPRHHWQIFNATTMSSASAMFGTNGRSSSPVKFQKFLTQNTLEYGLTDYVTLFATPTYVSAEVETAAGKTTRASGSSVEAGARILLLSHIGKLSLQSSYKAAGPFDLSNSANQSPARQVELRLLYGNDFKLFGDDAFLDLQAAQRWINRGRPDETAFDLTAGLWLRRDTMVMAQSFNIVSAGSARALRLLSLAQGAALCGGKTFPTLVAPSRRVSLACRTERAGRKRRERRALDARLVSIVLHAAGNRRAPVLDLLQRLALRRLVESRKNGVEACLHEFLEHRVGENIEVIVTHAFEYALSHNVGIDTAKDVLRRLAWR